MNIKIWKYWTIINVVLFTLVLGQAYFGLLGFLLANDKTFLGLLIIGIFVYANIKVGLDHFMQNYDDEHVFLWFISDTLLSIGLVGTLLGFIIVFWSVFGPGVILDPTNISTMITAMTNMAGGMSTAILTSLVGLISSMILKLQLVILEE